MGIAKYPWLCGKLLALAFIFFGGGVLATIIVPVVLLFSNNKVDLTQGFVRKNFQFYIWCLTNFGMITLSVREQDDFKKCAGKIVVANHLTLLDVVLLMALVPRAQCIVKSDLWSHRFLGSLMRSAGYIRNDLAPDELLKQCQDSLNDGRCLIIFPEGTRGKPEVKLGPELKFHRGFANIAYYTKCPIQTVVITCNPLILYRDEPLLKVPEQRPFFQVRMGDCIDKEFYLRYDCRGIAVRKIVEKIETYYRKTL